MKTARKYLAFARIGAARTLAERAELYGRALFFAIILGVFSALWRAVAEAGMPIASEPEQLVWYLAATEWIFLSAPQLHPEIQEEVRRGELAYKLPRPVSYVGALFAQCLGTLAVRAPVMAVAAGTCAFLFTGRLPEPAALACVIPLGLLAAALLSALYLTMGLLSFWLTDVTPVYWVSQKLLFVLGGLMLPLELYPTWLQRAAGFTPFPALLGGPASFLLAAPPGRVEELVSRLLLWSLLVGFGASWLFRRAMRGLQIDGG
jgi:ABC-2 type transport system permease protein